MIAYAHRKKTCNMTYFSMLGNKNAAIKNKGHYHALWNGTYY